MKSFIFFILLSLTSLSVKAADQAYLNILLQNLSHTEALFTLAGVKPVSMIPLTKISENPDVAHQVLTDAIESKTLSHGSLDFQWHPKRPNTLIITNKDSVRRLIASEDFKNIMQALRVEKPKNAYDAISFFKGALRINGTERTAPVWAQMTVGLFFGYPAKEIIAQSKAVGVNPPVEPTRIVSYANNINYPGFASYSVTASKEEQYILAATTRVLEFYQGFESMNPLQFWTSDEVKTYFEAGLKTLQCPYDLK